MQCLLADCADAYAIPVGFAEHVADAFALSADAVFSNLILVDEQGLNGFSAILGNLSVDGCTTFGAGITLDFHLGIVVVLQIGSNALNVGELAGVNSALALTEGNEHVGSIAALGLGNGLDDGLLVAAVVQGVLEILDGLLVGSNLSVLVGNGAAQGVDLSVQTVDFSLVISTAEGEVVGTVAVLEVIGHAGEQLEVAHVDVVTFQIVIFNSVGEAVYDGGLNTYGPSLLLADVEVQVQAELASHAVCITVAYAIGVAPTGTYDTFYLKQAGLALITCEEVAEVDDTVQANVAGVDNVVVAVSMRRAVFESINVSLTFKLQTEHGGEHLGEVQAGDRSSIRTGRFPLSTRGVSASPKHSCSLTLTIGLSAP